MNASDGVPTDSSPHSDSASVTAAAPLDASAASSSVFSFIQPFLPSILVFVGSLSAYHAAAAAWRWVRARCAKRGAASGKKDDNDDSGSAGNDPDAIFMTRFGMTRKEYLAKRAAELQTLRKRVNEPLFVEVPSAGKTKPEAEQGLRWVKETLKVDADGDEAHEFLGPF